MITDIASFQREKPALYRRFLNIAAHRQAGVRLVMENVNNPGNLGAIVRSCDALGIQHISYLPAIHHEKAAEIMSKSSCGASHWLDCKEFTSTEAHFSELREAGWHIAGTSSEIAGRSLYAIDFTQFKKMAIVIGNEVKGLTPATLASTDLVINIPMHSIIRSLNVSVATAIILAEVTRQRQQANFLLDPKAQEAMVHHFLASYLRKRDLPFGNALESLKQNDI